MSTFLQMTISKTVKMPCLLFTLVFLSITEAYDYDMAFSPGFHICEQEDTSIYCFCHDRENFTISPIFDEDVTRITVEGCGTVKLSFAALTYLTLEELQFINIENLQIFSFALSPIHGMRLLKIANVSDLDVRQHAFVGLSDIKQLILSNVTADTLIRDAFSSISNVEYFLVENSLFNYVEQLAFAVHNVTTFHILNSEFHSFENFSILIHKSDKVLFENCHFEQTEDSTFVVSFVEEVSFIGCSFGKLETTSIQSKELQIFSMTNCSIEELKPGAFSGLEVREKIIFINNSIELSYETSLTPFTSNLFRHINIEYCCNMFSCDCNAYWMWNNAEDVANNSVLGNSICIGDSTKTVSNYKPVLDSYNNCMTLELKSIEKQSDSISILNETKSLKSFGINVEITSEVILLFLTAVNLFERWNRMINV